MNESVRIGIIGGSGFYALEGLEPVGEYTQETPFGAPSDSIRHGRLGGRDVFFLARHGQGHRLLPSDINHRANVFAFKRLGVDAVFSVSAVGSLREDLRPRDLVLPDQYVDRTKQSASHTFFGGGLVAHVAFADPTCPVLSEAAARAAETVIRRSGSPVRVHRGGTYVCMEGPAFSTRAESAINRQLGGDVIGMTSLPEAKLCREAGLCYQSLAMVTDYDCWRETGEPVTVEQIVGHLTANAQLALDVLRELIPALPVLRGCACATSLSGAIVTDPACIPTETRERLAPLLSPYL